MWEKNIMVKKDKTRHKSEKTKERGSKAVPSISCIVVVAFNSRLSNGFVTVMSVDASLTC